MKRWIKVLLELIILICAGLYIYHNYDYLKEKADSLFNNIINYAENKGIIDIEGTGNLVSLEDLKYLTDTGITGDSLSFSSTYYPYYEMLTNNEKKVYKQIYANAKELKKDFVPVSDINSKELEKIIYAINYDHPELFYLDTSYGYKYTEDDKCVQIILKYNETIDDIYNAKSKFNTESYKLIEGAKNYKSNYEREKYVHDELIKTVNYNLNSSVNQSAYSALVNKESVCAGYAKAFQYIMTELEIPTYYVAGTSTEGEHAWNIISLSDGFYNIDVTFDDTTGTHKYFNLESSEFDTNHNRTDISVNLPNSYGTKFLGYRKVKGYDNFSATLDSD